MNKTLCFVLILLFSCFSFYSHAQVKEQYNIPEVLTFDSVQYKLCANYHSDNYYKQEYIPKGESPKHFNKMVMIDFVITDIAMKDFVAIKINELQERRKNDPIVQTDLRYNDQKDEFILDFILSGHDGFINMVERNVYRYKNYTDSNGHKGVLLFAISQRGYGNYVRRFLTNLKSTRISDIDKLIQYDIPNIVIK